MGGVSVIPGVLKLSQRGSTIVVVVKCYVSVRRSRFPVNLSARVDTLAGVSCVPGGHG